MIGPKSGHLALLALLVLAPRVGAQGEPLSSEPMAVTPQQTAAVQSGLEWLASQQNADGSWTAKVGYKLNNDYEYTKISGFKGD